MHNPPPPCLSCSTDSHLAIIFPNALPLSHFCHLPHPYSFATFSLLFLILSSPHTFSLHHCLKPPFIDSPFPFPSSPLTVNCPSLSLVPFIPYPSSSCISSEPSTSLLPVCPYTNYFLPHTTLTFCFAFFLTCFPLPFLPNLRCHISS